jgi:GTPase SAR1 family protein
MVRKQSLSAVLAERMCRPQRLGVFGRRGVGKTTLLAMLYREAVAGRLPGLRLAAADARTATYLADKVVQLDAGQVLPPTLAETDLHLHLYHNGRRIELLVKDYQGEHVALGRHEAIRDFLRDCDAVWLCLDDGPSSADRLRDQQEVEQVVEDYLAVKSVDVPHRPMAILLTKSDLHSNAGDAIQHARDRFTMALHALATHCPGFGVFAVSSLGRSPGEENLALRPTGLTEPLVWLASAIERQDGQRLETLWERAGDDVSLVSRCIGGFANRYPGSPVAITARQRLATVRGRRNRRRLAMSAVALTTAFLAMTSYDALGAFQARRFADQNAGDPVAVRGNWLHHQAWHPTRNLFRPAGARAETDLLRALDERIEGQRYAARLGELTRHAADADADPELVWQQYRNLREEFPERAPDETLEHLRDVARARRDAARERAARAALAELDKDEPQADLARLIARADGLLREYGDTPAGDQVSKRRETYLRRLDERDIEAARDYSAREPLNFYTRRQRFREYLDHHPSGTFAAEAVLAVDAISGEWDRHDYRAVRDHFRDQPGDVRETEALARAYLAAHGDGRFRDVVTGLLRWTERAVEPAEYRVVLRSGQLDKKIAWFFSRGPDLAVEIEVNGVRYGPSNIVANRYDPTWDYEFPRRVRWKLGDPVRIRVFDHDYYKRLAVDIASDPNDPLAFSMLSGEVVSPSGKNSLVFESDFRLPELPTAE